MKKLILATSIFLSSTVLLAGSTSDDGMGTAQRVGTKFIKSGNDIKSINYYQALNNQSDVIAEVKTSEVEALMTLSGDYARPADIRDGFVDFKGATVEGDSIYLNPSSQNFEIESVIFDNGFRNSAASFLGGDMGGGGK